MDCTATIKRGQFFSYRIQEHSLRSLRPDDRGDSIRRQRHHTIRELHVGSINLRTNRRGCIGIESRMFQMTDQTNDLGRLVIEKTDVEVLPNWILAGKHGSCEL